VVALERGQVEMLRRWTVSGVVILFLVRLFLVDRGEVVKLMEFGFCGCIG
jgi:hypothetical protein